MRRNEFLRKSVAIAGITGFPFSSAFVSQKGKGAIELTDIIRMKELISSPTGKNWIFTGDSVTQGAKHTYGFRAYPEIFSERIRWEMGRSYDFVINTAINGSNSADLVKDFNRRVTRFSPSVVSIMLGINDCAYFPVTEKIFKENLHSIIREIRELDAIPVLHTPNRIDERPSKEYTSREKLGSYVRIVNEVANEAQTILIDNWKHWEDYDYPDWLDDALHPNHSGHLEIARRMFVALSIFDKNSFSCTGNK